MNAFVMEDGSVCVKAESMLTPLTPDQALALASELITASNVANGYTTTGVFA